MNKDWMKDIPDTPEEYKKYMDNLALEKGKEHNMILLGRLVYNKPNAAIFQGMHDFSEDYIFCKISTEEDDENKYHYSTGFPSIGNYTVSKNPIPLIEYIQTHIYDRIHGYFPIGGPRQSMKGVKVKLDGMTDWITFDDYNNE